MKKEGYGADFSCAVTAASSCIGPVIPPSTPMIIAATITGMSVTKLFVAGIIPGILLGVSLGVVSYCISCKKNHPKGKRVPLKSVIKKFFDAFWALLMTIIILYGIIGGFFTPTEASMIAVAYAIIVGIFVYKELRLRDLPKIFLDSAITTASIMVLVSFANVYAWILTSEQIPQMVADAMLRIAPNKYVLLFLINMLLLFVGTFMETVAAIMILFPILLNTVLALGVDPIQFAWVVVLNLVLGLTTPPVGVCLFITSSIGKISLGQVAKAVLPFLIVSLVVLLMVTYIPELTLFLPRLLFGE